tara:strand:- start:21759 stop:25169 length:3411 start_codon:yes stop_codon:yes gene_type:complete
MATYIPGVEDKIPQSQPFVPDYKFLSDVLHTRQDRFDKNYKQLNDVYGKVVYADLTRNDNKYVRDQYAEQLAPQIKQISGLDLSLQENVDAAYGLFKPFYEDKQVIKDLTATATLKQQRKKMSSFKDSSIREVREKYWDYGRQGLDIWQEDFKNADPQKALSMGLPQYVEDVDLVETAMMLLDNSALGDMTSDMFVSQDNKWLITQKSGSVITAAPTGRMIEVKDKNGKKIMVPETENLALNHVKDRLMDDPKVQAAYHLRNFVDMRNYVKENSEGMGGDDAAKKAWAEKTMEEYKPLFEEEVASLSKLKEIKKLEVSSWETYADDVGIMPGSEDDISYLNSLDELELANTVITSQTQRLQDATAPTDDIKDLLNKAYSLAMGTQMGQDMLTSASAYAKKTQTREMEANPNYTAWVEHQYAMARLKYKEASDNVNKEKERLNKPVQVPLYRYKAGDESTTGKNSTSADAQGIIDGEDITSDAIGYNQETAKDRIKYNLEEQKRIIKEVYIKNAPGLNLDGSKFTPIFSPDLMVGNNKLEIGEIYYPDKKTLSDGTVDMGLPQEYGTGAIGGVRMLGQKIEEDSKSIPQRLVNYPNETAMTWEQFNDLEDEELVEDMYMNMLGFINNSEAQFPSYMLLDNKTKSDFAYDIRNLRGNMTMFNEGVDKMAENYMQVQENLVKVDEDFKYAAQDGGSIFNNDGIRIQREDWINRYVKKWTDISNQEINSNMTQQNFQGEQFLPATSYTNPTTGSGDVSASEDLNQMQIINESDNQMQFPGGLNGGKYWQANMMGTEMPGAYGIQEYNVTVPKPRVDLIQKDAELYYDYMYAEVNKKMTKDGENAAEFGFNLSSFLAGQPETIGGDMFQSGEHQFKYDENAGVQTNAPALDFANQVLKILDGDVASFSVYSGGNIILEKGQTLGEQNPEMMNVIQQWYYSMGDNYGNNKEEGGGAPKKDGLDFSISYAKNRGGMDTDYAGYEIHFGTDWANSNVLGRYDKANGEYITGIVTNDKSSEFITDNVITILFDKSVDNNKYKTGDMETAWVMGEMKANDGRIIRNVPGAGTITIFSTGDGRYMYNEQLIQYEGNKKTIFQGQQIQVPASQIANVLATQEQRLIEMGSANMSQLKAYNTANNIKID